MSRALRATAAFLALTGLLATTGLGAATAVHVALEHEGPLRSAHAHHTDTDDHAHAHDHESVASPAGHDHGSTGGIERTPALEHRHPATFVADVQGRAGRAAVDPVSGGAADAPAALARGAWRPFVGPASRAGPATRSASLCRRSVVLQV